MSTFEDPIDDEDLSFQLSAAVAALSRPPAPELPGELRALARDLQAIAQGAGPTNADLARAARLEGWNLVVSMRGLRLAGQTIRHPILGTRRIVTSPVWILDPRGRWARTLSRLYALGRPHRATLMRPIRSRRLH